MERKNKTMELVAKLMTLPHAAKRCPGSPSPSTLWRWCRFGVIAANGERVRLQHQRVGGRLATSDKWVSEFLAALEAVDRESFGDPPAPSRRVGA